MLNVTFEAAFRKLFVYNILFEDADVDGLYLGLTGESRVLGISAAGCGLASMVRFRPQHIDAVDINGHHLALAALKMKAARDLPSYGLLYGLFGHGFLTSPKPTLESLCQGLPAWIGKYWSKHCNRFERSLNHQGLTAWMLGELRQQVGLGTGWMVDFASMPPAERPAAIRGLAEPILRKPLVRRMLNSPLNQLALGVNQNQLERMLDRDQMDIVDFILTHLERVARTDVETNWFAWYAAAGHFNHENPDAVPPYLRRTSHKQSFGAPTTFGFHHESILDVLTFAREGTWTHYSLCDAIDWMSRDAQILLLDEIHRTACDGATVLMRSVQDEDVVRACGRDSKFLHRAEVSARAAREERSCQYKRVDFYSVKK